MIYYVITGQNQIEFIALNKLECVNYCKKSDTQYFSIYKWPSDIGIFSEPFIDNIKDLIPNGVKILMDSLDNKK